MELVPYLFQIDGVMCFLSEKLSQDALKNSLGFNAKKEDQQQSYSV